MGTFVCKITVWHPYYIIDKPWRKETVAPKTTMKLSPCQRDEEYQHATILQRPAEVHHLDQRKPITSLPLSIYVKIPPHAVQIQRLLQIQKIPGKNLRNQKRT